MKRFIIFAVLYWLIVSLVYTASLAEGDNNINNERIYHYEE